MSAHQDIFRRLGEIPPPGERVFYTTLMDMDRLCDRIRDGKTTVIDRERLEATRDRISAILDNERGQQ